MVAKDSQPNVANIVIIIATRKGVQNTSDNVGKDMQSISLIGSIELMQSLCVKLLYRQCSLTKLRHC